MKSQELMRPIAERLFEKGMPVREVYEVLQGYANWHAVARWRKEWGEAQAESFQAVA